ncbi:MAG: WD40 repeat [Candidatus Kentron sp. G]|nr:MAG: WD40 repeat [Candidatus Kentron sp. G]VFN01715.1 MAG: WD40 repeat [Candidatus Kentron sp. G]VFN02772.1 MAG: WD40 repeat [Candidatus Kentron sp. G]
MPQPPLIAHHKPSQEKMWVHAVAFTPDGRELIVGEQKPSGNHPGAISRMDAATGALRWRREGAIDHFWSLALSPDGRRLALGGGGIQLWDAEAGKERAQVPHAHGEEYLVWSVAFAPLEDSAGLTLASGGSDNSVCLWMVKGNGEPAVPPTMTETARLEGYENNVRTVAFSPDGRLLASGSWDHTVRLWRGKGGGRFAPRAKLEGHENWVQSVAFSPDGQLLASGADDKSIRLWDVSTALDAGVATARELARIEGHEGGVLSVVFAPLPVAGAERAYVLASGADDNTVGLWAVRMARQPDSAQITPRITELARLEVHKNSVWSVAFSPIVEQGDGPIGCRLASGSWDGTVAVWDVSELIAPYLAPPPRQGVPDPLAAWIARQARTVGRVVAVETAPEPAMDDWAPQLAGADDEGCLGVLRPENPGQYAARVAISPDGRVVYGGTADGRVCAWALESGALLWVTQGHSGIIEDLALHPDGPKGEIRLASGSSDNTIKLWEAASGRETQTLRGHSDSVWSVAFSPDGGTIASGSWDDTIKLWDGASGRETRTLRGHSYAVRSVAFGPAGETLASGSIDNTIKLWDWASGRETRTLRGHSGTVRSVVFSPAGETLASGSHDNTIKLWDVASGRETQTLRGHSGWVYCLPWGEKPSPFRATE